eukprot:7388856-Prymnesium_polylepis.1
MSWRMGGRAVGGRRCAERVVRGGGRCSRLYVGVCDLKLVSVRACQQPGLIGVAGSGELVLSVHARRPSEAPRGSSDGVRGGVLRVDGTWHADGARAGDAQQTLRGHARSSIHKSGVRSQHQRQCQSTGLALLRQQRALG